MIGIDVLFAPTAAAQPGITEGDTALATAIAAAGNVVVPFTFRFAGPARESHGDFAAQQAEKTGGNALTKAVSAVKAWLYEGVNTDSQPVSGTLVKVETGMQNDDYVEILSGVSEGDVVLYTASSTSTSSSMMMGMGMMSMGGGSGGSRGMGGGPGGF